MKNKFLDILAKAILAFWALVTIACLVAAPIFKPSILIAYVLIFLMYGLAWAVNRLLN